MGVVKKVGEASVPVVTSQRSEFHIGTFRLNQKWSQRSKDCSWTVSEFIERVGTQIIVRKHS